AEGFWFKFWDFLFSASFGFVVTSSVSIAGVLLVFCYLIVPSVAAMLYADTIGRRLAIGWTMGTVVSALGVYLSLHLDLPTGATIVCTFGLVLIVMAAVRPLVQSRAPHAVSELRRRNRRQGADLLSLRNGDQRSEVPAGARAPPAVASAAGDHGAGDCDPAAAVHLVPALLSRGTRTSRACTRCLSGRRIAATKNNDRPQRPA